MWTMKSLWPDHHDTLFRNVHRSLLIVFLFSCHHCFITIKKKVIILNSSPTLAESVCTISVCF